jgi:3-isopropylmalate/(R)-2-methylmalate dehydratase small subunit
MEPLVRVSSIVVPLLRDNIDTDAIIPAAYMRSLSTDPATGLFAGWRHRPDGSLDPAFVLNEDRFRSAQILLAGKNFGCGSSRENAVWALHRWGLRCVLALGFSDIFRENAFKNGLLPITLPPEQHACIAAGAAAGDLHLTIDVRERAIVLPSGDRFTFELDERRQASLISGADEITETLGRSDAIAAFREAHGRTAPWLYIVK